MPGKDDPKAPPASEGAQPAQPQQPAEPSTDLVAGESEQVEREAVAYLERAPEPVRDVLLTRLVRQTFVGPLPPPEMIEAYNEAVPGMGRELLDAFLEEGRHRRSLNAREFDLLAEDTRSRRRLDHRGMTMGAIVAVLGLVGSVTAILAGHDWAGATLGGVELTALVAVFVLGRRKAAPESAPGAKRKPPKKKTN